MRFKQFSRRSNLNRNLLLLLNQNRGHWKRRKKRDWEISMRFLRVKTRNRGRRNKRRSKVGLSLRRKGRGDTLDGGLRGEERKEVCAVYTFSFTLPFSIPFSAFALPHSSDGEERERGIRLHHSRALARSEDAGRFRFSIISALEKMNESVEMSESKNS